MDMDWNGKLWGSDKWDLYGRVKSDVATGVEASKLSVVTGTHSKAVIY